MQIGRHEFRTYPINERKWMVARFLQQKEKEEEYLNKIRNKKD